MTQPILLNDGQRYHSVLRRIDSVWTLTFTVERGYARIESYSRDNTIGYEQEKRLLKHRLIENDDRHVQEVELYVPASDNTFPHIEGQLLASMPVINPQYVFSYN